MDKLYLSCQEVFGGFVVMSVYAIVTQMSSRRSSRIKRQELDRDGRG